MKFNKNKLVGIFALILLFIPDKAVSQCVEIDPSFSVSNISPVIGEEVVFTYDGSVDFCADCSYDIEYNGVIGGPSHSGDAGIGIEIGDVIGRHVYSATGTNTVTLTISSTALSCVESYTYNLTVSEPTVPTVIFKTSGSSVCYDASTLLDYELEAFGTTGYTLTNVAWNFGDAPGYINTAGLTTTHTYDEPKGVYYVVAVATYDDGSEVLEVPVVCIVNDGDVTGFTGTEPYFKAAFMDGDPSFTYTISYPGGSLADVDFIYQGTPFPQPVEDVDLGWGPVDWNHQFTIGGVTKTLITPFYYEVGEQIIATESLSVGSTYEAVHTVWWDNVGLGFAQCSSVDTVVVNIPSTPCDSCNSFKPQVNKKYWMSAWVKVDEGQVKSYNPSEHASGDPIDPLTVDDAYIEFYFSGADESVYFFPTGEIIDGWQRIVGAFTIPDGSLDFDVVLVADESDDTYFDDIRVHPFNGSMKSYVYDGQTFWLTSELDDNNYATFYEYDQEGGLIRIKKETSRGIVTIQETRSGTLTIE